MRPRGFTIAIAVLVAAGGLLATATSQDASAADPEFYKVKLIGVSTYYGSESWKNNPSLYGADPLGGFFNFSSQADGAVGHRVTLRVQLTDDQGNVVSPTDPENPFVNLTARIDTPSGPLRAYVAREGTSLPLATASTIFNLHFDVDGSNEPPGGPAPGEALIALLPGLQTVKVDITKGTVRATAVNAGSTDLVFDYGNPAVDVQIPGLGSGNYVAQVPDSLFRLYNDIGFGSSVRMVTEPVPSDLDVTANYVFGAPQATVRWYALAAERLPQPQGTITIHKKLLAEGTTDGAGAISFTTKASALLDYDAKDYSSALVVVAAALDPATDIGATFPQEFAQGSGRIRTGATEFVVPVSNADVRVRGFRINTDLADESQSRGAPDPIRDAALAANALDVEIFDAGGSSGSTSGDAVAFVPNSPGSSVLTRANVVSRPDVSPSLTYRMASLPVLPIQEAHVTKYRVMALLYGPGANDFYGLAFADRGWEPSFSAGTAFVNDRGIVYLNVTSVNTNYDLRPMEAGFDLRVVLRINVPDLQINETETFDLKEGLRESKTFTLTADRPADVRVEFIGTTGDTISDTFGLTMRFVEPPPKRNFVDRIPGFEAVALIAVLGALAWRSYLRRS